MIFGLYAFLVGICLTLIIVGITIRKYSGIGLIGFGMLFILSFIILSGNLEVEIGSNSTSSFTYDGDGNVQTASQDLDYQYEVWNDTTSHQIGYWIAIFSAFGFFGLLYSINKGGKNEEE